MGERRPRRMRRAPSGVLVVLVACSSEPAREPAPRVEPVVAPAIVSPVDEPVAQSTPPALEIVGAPLAGYERLRGNIGRSIWDLEEHDGRVFLGYGDGTANTGPTDILAFDPRAGAFHVEATFDEEAVMAFRRFGDRLFVPGIDPLGAADDGALYVRERGAWRTVKIPAAVHVFDAIVWEGRWFVALQQKPNRAVVLESKDDGASWRTHSIAGWRAHTFFTVDDGLYVSAYGGGVSRADGDAFRSIETDLGPVAPPSTDGSVDTWAHDTIVSKAARCGASTWVIAGIGSVTDGYSTTMLKRLRLEGAALKSTIASVDGRPEDLFVWRDRCHVVTNATVDDVTTTRILRANDDSWELVAETSARAIARSGLRTAEHWYLGLACSSECGEDAGLLARLAATDE